MNKLPILKPFTLICLSLGTLYSQAQDSTSTRPVRTPAKTMIVNPRLQNRLTQPAGTTTPRKPAATKPTTGTNAKPAPVYRTPAVVYTQPVTPATAVTDKSLSGQYQYLLTKLYGYQRPVASAFYKNLTDSIVVQKRKVKQLQASLNTQSKTVKDLQTDVSTKQESLDASNNKADSISLLGIPMSKSSYNLLMWGLVLVFGATAAVVIMQSGNNRREAKYRTKLYDDLDEEYKTYKTKSNEKEKRLARDLQTARNKLEEITGNPEY